MGDAAERSPLTGSPRGEQGDIVEDSWMEQKWEWFMSLVPDKEIVLFCLYTGYVASVIARSTIDVTSSALVADKTLGIDSSQMANIFAIGMAAALAGKLINGLVIDVIGGTLAFCGGLLLMGVASVCFAFLSSYAAFACCWFVMRYAQTACFPSMGRVAKGWWSEEEIPSAWGFLATSCRVGAIVAFFVLGPLLAVVHWRGIYVFAGLLAIVVFAYNYRLLRDHPEASTPSKMRKFSAAVINPSSETDYPLKAFAGECVQSEKVWLMLGGMACLTAITEIPSILPMYFRDMHFKDNSTMSHAAASTMVVSYPIGSCLATLCCGQIYDSLNRKQQMYLISSLLAGACCCFIALWVMDLQRGPNDDPQLIKTIVILFFIGVFTAPCYYLPPTFFAMKYGGMKFYATLACALDAAGYMCSILFFQVVGRRGKAGINWNEVLFTLVVLMFATTGFFVRFMWLEVEKPTKAALEGLDT